MQKTILISGTYPILDEKLNDLLGRSYDIAALEQPFPVNARKFGWVEAVVVYVPYCGERRMRRLRSVIQRRARRRTGRRRKGCAAFC